MKTVGFYEPLPIEDDNALVDIDMDIPQALDNDLIVKIDAISVNPADVKIRASACPQKNTPRILGYDAVGTVIAKGKDVKKFEIGDRVFYAGAINRMGSYSEYHAVDYALVAKAPKTINAEQAASFPLTVLTAYEMLYEHMHLDKITDANKTLLIVGGAGGVGSIAIQLAKQIKNLTVIATVSRPQSKDWCKKMGADYVIDHRKSLEDELKSLGIEQVDAIFSTTHTDQYLLQYEKILIPFGQLGLIDDPKIFDITTLKSKSISVHWEFMFTRSLHQSADRNKQGIILQSVAQLIDQGVIKPTTTKILSPFNAKTMRQAHAIIEDGKMVGKLVVNGFHIDKT